MLYQLLTEIDTDTSKFLIGMEATGLLFENLYIFLQKLGYNVVLLNPYRAA
jgi:transposase